MKLQEKIDFWQKKAKEYGDYKSNIIADGSNLGDSISMLKFQYAEHINSLHTQADYIHKLLCKIKTLQKQSDPMRMIVRLKTGKYVNLNNINAIGEIRRVFAERGDALKFEIHYKTTDNPTEVVVTSYYHYKDDPLFSFNKCDGKNICSNEQVREIIEECRNDLVQKWEKWNNYSGDNNSEDEG